MVSYYQLAKDGTTATPTNLKNLNKEQKRHRDVTDISFCWISDVMKNIAEDMKERKRPARR